MAKQQRQAWHKEPSRGRKECPACHVYVAARSRNCPKCNAAFKTAGGQAKKGKQSASTEALKIIEAINAKGGASAVRQLLENYRAAEKELATLGGPEGAEEALRLVEELGAAMGKK